MKDKLLWGVVERFDESIKVEQNRYRINIALLFVSTPWICCEISIFSRNIFLWSKDQKISYMKARISNA